MEKLFYQRHEAQRHTAAIKDALERACRGVFTGPKAGFRLKDGPWYSPGPAEKISVMVFQRVRCCRRKPVCTIEIQRPKTKDGTHDYTQASATFLEPSQQAGNARLVGHLQRQCPFLPKIEVTLGYEVGGQP